MPAYYQMQYGAPLVDLLEWKLESYFERKGFHVLLEYINREGPDILQLKRGNEIVSIYVHTISEAEKRLEMECSSDGTMRLAVDAMRELVGESLHALLGPIAGVSEDELRMATDRHLERLWEEARALG